MLTAAPWASGTGDAATCGPLFVPPHEAPNQANRYNGIGLSACFDDSGPHHVFVIGSWGGQGDPPMPADRRSPVFPGSARAFVRGVDDQAQQRVAHQMQRRAVTSDPDYVLNAGGNFFWGGILTLCGARPYDRVNTHQWGPVFEKVYTGQGLDGKQWLGVLGNHDYGGYTFAMGWDQAIGYTWGGPPPCTHRWMTPAQYWSASVKYPDFAVDYYFMDTNHILALPPHDDPDHNLCSLRHTPKGVSCGKQGPLSAWDCPMWFRRLWNHQVEWIQHLLLNSTADWQVIVTHFPPVYGREFWKKLSEEYGVDLFVTGYTHQQEVHYLEHGNNSRTTAWIVSGGGGGITSEGVPDLHGDDDQYGFFDLTLSKKELLIEAISHGGQLRKSVRIQPRPASAASKSSTAAGHGHEGQQATEALAQQIEGHMGKGTGQQKGAPGTLTKSEDPWKEKLIAPSARREPMLLTTPENSLGGPLKGRLSTLPARGTHMLLTTPKEPPGEQLAVHSARGAPVLRTPQGEPWREQHTAILTQNVHKLLTTSEKPWREQRATPVAGRGTRGNARSVLGDITAGGGIGHGAVAALKAAKVSGGQEHGHRRSAEIGVSQLLRRDLRPLYLWLAFAALLSAVAILGCATSHILCTERGRFRQQSTKLHKPGEEGQQWLSIGRTFGNSTKGPILGHSGYSYQSLVQPGCKESMGDQQESGDEFFEALDELENRPSMHCFCWPQSARIYKKLRPA